MTAPRARFWLSYFGQPVKVTLKPGQEHGEWADPAITGLPLWRRVSESQRDYAAEAMGY